MQEQSANERVGGVTNDTAGNRMAFGICCVGGAVSPALQRILKGMPRMPDAIILAFS